MIPSSGVQLEYPAIEEIYRSFAGLAATRGDLGGLLLLYCGLDGGGIATVMAANVAGAASLGVEADAAVARQALRGGVCDFVVNSLDEGLRILKNEVRQRRAASVVITEDPSVIVAAIVERGVQPDVLAVSVPQLEQRGAALLEMPDFSGDGMKAVSWSVQREPLRWLPMLDALAAGAVRKDDSAYDWRLRWLEAAPRYLGKMYAGQRLVRMTEAEADRFQAAVETAVGTGEIQVATKIAQGDREVLIET